ncbi:MAG: family 16 glycosylhydrolase [Brevundimonas sp.]
MLPTLALVGLLAASPAVGPIQSQAPPEAQARWETVWRDDFDGPSLDRTKWAPEVACWGGGNDERQCYTDRDANIQVRDGTLHLIARPERFTGPLRDDGGADASEASRTQDYTSGKVRTLGLAAWRYGRFSARMKLPTGQGTWPAFWMMPADAVYGGWPLSGEIDIMEAVNLGAACSSCPEGLENRTSGAIHFGGRIPDNRVLFQRDEASPAPGPAEEWRVYTVEWAEGVIQWFVDDRLFLRVTSADWHTDSPAAAGRPHAPFDQPFYLMLNLAVGGRYPEQIADTKGFDPSAFPAEVQVDWVSVEQCAGDPETGRACLSDAPWDGRPLGSGEVEGR